MSDAAKQEVVTFKASADLVEAMRGVPNRSAFIRDAILAALDSACPLCGGTGILTPKQAEHWAEFSETHTIEECRTCHEMHVRCEYEARGAGGVRPQRKG